MCTIDDNKLIAKFMGYKQSTSKEVGANLVNDVYEWYLKDVGYYYINGDWHAEDYLLFHLDWNWLMNVVDKIESFEDDEELYKYIIEIFGTTVNVTDTSCIKPIAETFERTKIKATYKAVIEFINFYNRQQHEN